MLANKGALDLEVTSTEVQNNFGTYLKYAQFEDVYITRNGRRVAVLQAYEPGQLAEGKSLYSGGQPKMSLEEFLNFAIQSDERYEYIKGEVFLLASPSFQHQKIVLALGSLLRDWSKGTPCEALVAPFDVILQTGDTFNVVQPDVVVLCDLENINERGRYEGIPAIVVEVLSGSNRSYDMIKKLDVYRVSGVKEYWIVNPFTEEIYTYIFKDYEIHDYRVYLKTDQLGSSALDGLNIVVEQVFL